MGSAQGAVERRREWPLQPWPFLWLARLPFSWLVERVCIAWGGGGGAGKVSESPRETVESLDQAGKGRVDWEAEKEPGSGVGSSSPLEHLGPTQLGFPFQST